MCFFLSTPYSVIFSYIKNFCSIIWWDVVLWIIVHNFKLLTFFIQNSILDVLGVLDLSLIMPGLLITSNKRLFQIAVMVGGWGKSPQWNLKFYWGNFFRGWKKHEEEWFWQFEPLSKLQTAFCEYWASIKIKINMM